MISKIDFCSIIENMRLQVYNDKKNGQLFQEAFGLPEVFVYDNNGLYKSILLLLRLYFPIGADGFCEIEHYCFMTNFGKFNEKELITPEDLYEQLISKI